MSDDAEAPRGAPQYRIEHRTHYDYSAPVSQSWQLARLTPGALPWQAPRFHKLAIEPLPDERRDAVDAFGNAVTHFALHRSHRVLDVRMSCEVEMAPRPPADPRRDGRWRAVAEAMREPGGAADLAALPYSEATPLLPYSERARSYAQPSLATGRGWLEAVSDLMHRIHADFEFDPHATTVSTRVEEVLHLRRGVCQDFTHLMLACLRAHGLAARYVSGYLLTEPPPGRPRLLGADASHAWVAAYAPQYGWIEFDPTNDQLADTRYVTLATGPDFGDAMPLRGVIQGGGSQRMEVGVSVVPLE